MGVLGLRHLIYYAETYTTSFREKLKELKYAKKNLEPEYLLPFCTMGINISSMLIDLFQINDEDQEPDPQLLRRYLLQNNGLLNIYCLVFEYTNILWTSENYSYLNFNVMLQNVKEYVSNIYHNSGTYDTIEDIEEMMFFGKRHNIKPLFTPDFGEILITGDGEELLNLSERKYVRGTQIKRKRSRSYLNSSTKRNERRRSCDFSSLEASDTLSFIEDEMDEILESYSINEEEKKHASKEEMEEHHISEEVILMAKNSNRNLGEMLLRSNSPDSIYQGRTQSSGNTKYRENAGKVTKSTSNYTKKSERRSLKIENTTSISMGNGGRKRTKSKSTKRSPSQSGKSRRKRRSRSRSKTPRDKTSSTYDIPTRIGSATELEPRSTDTNNQKRKRSPRSG
eukprot:TRINITY_DN8979_c0_g1_i1.p1 TRINITY_DN8979_c0_g1~~TRINITY_DN8979_c0_g1_i1.p1  ORF type:complete len:396 (-),score=83.77 TRINITY_DN8979_c0_g1_i1:127-1314(-)